MIFRSTILLALAVAVIGVALDARADRRSMRIAAALLLENQPICEMLSREGRLRRLSADAARAALGRENLEIATELTRGLDSTRPEIEDLERAVRLQRRLCAGPPAPGEREAVVAELRAVLHRLDLLLPEDPERRSKLLDRFLARRERAVVDAAGSIWKSRASFETRRGGEIPGHSDRRVASAFGPAAVDAPLVEFRMPLAGEVDLGSVESPSRKAAGTGAQLWHPLPRDLATRERLRRKDLATRIALWRARVLEALSGLDAARSDLAHRLETHSLEQLQALCERLGRLAADVDSQIVLESPERIMRSDLHRLLVGYAAAGRWCKEHRFSLAWMEISAANERWLRLRSRMETLSR